MAPVWGYVPAYTGAGTPVQQTVIDSGLAIGYNVSGREAWILLSSAYTMGKCAYYRIDESQYCGFLCAVKSTEYNQQTPSSAILLARVIYAGTYSYTTISKGYFSSTYGDFNYSASGSTITQVILSELKDYIPLYNNLSEALDALNDGYWDGPPPPPPTDPYGPGGYSGGGGGTGTFDNTSVPVDFPPLPTLSATDAGFITLFNPSKLELVALADYMWNNPLFDLDTWKKIVADPMDAILGLAIVPVAITPGTSKTLKIGNIATSVSMTEAARQFEEVDCGTLNVEECWGAYLDYDPYTKAEIYLPYIGTHAVSADDIMGKSVHIKYHVDILTGACCAYIKCGDSVLYTFSGQCSTSVPIASKDLTNVVNGVLGAAKAVGSMVASGGASAPSQIPGLVSTAVNALKPNIEKSGSLAGTSGMLATQIPYLILTRPRQALPEYQNQFIGYPSFVTATLGDLTGYTEVESIHPENIPATKAELSEIETLLGNGVIF